MRNWLIKLLGGFTQASLDNHWKHWKKEIKRLEDKLKNPLRGIVKVDFTKDMEDDPTVVVQIRVNEKIILSARPEKREELFQLYANEMVVKLRYKYRRIADELRAINTGVPADQIEIPKRVQTRNGGTS